MFKELKDELANLHDAYDADEDKKEIERIRRHPALQLHGPDKINVLIRDHNPYIQVPYASEKLSCLIIKFLPTALAGEGRSLLREIIDKKLLANESRVIEKTVRHVKMAHVVVPVSAAYKGQNKKDEKAVAAAAMARKSEHTGTAKGGPRGGALYEQPNGQWCSKGTCNFTHDKLNPGGPLGQTAARQVPEKQAAGPEDQERARENNANRLQVANLPICLAMASPETDMQAVDVNGCGANFT
eukprot:1135214-Pleurochrysis_carterae.AAC.3